MIPNYPRLEAKTLDAVVVGMADAEAVEHCARAGAGATVTLQVGGKLDRRNAEPLEVSGKVLRIEPGEGPQSKVLQVEGVTLVLTADRRAFNSLASFQRVGINALSHNVVVVKLEYLYPELRDHAPRAIMALSPGLMDLRIETLPYRRVPRPMVPLDPEA